MTERLFFASLLGFDEPSSFHRAFRAWTGIGLLSLVFGGGLVSDAPNGFARGVAIPFLVMGLVMTVVGGGVGYRAPALVAALQACMATSPEPTVQAERARMERVSRAWTKYFVTWAVR